ncbi:MAG TPA: HEAT repeat domain-containing protein [Turneriella sp.]|nr:HEAT repeat domain-containing protein [Turneriella sp.]
MKTSVFFLTTILSVHLYAETSNDYRTQRAFEAGEDSESRQENAIRECAVSQIQKCVYPIIAQLKKEGKENAPLRRESANALGRMHATEAREPLLQMLSKEDDEFAKGAAIGALGLIANKEDIKTVAPYTTDKSRYIRRRTARALYDFDNKEASAEAANKAAAEKDDLTRAELLNAALRYESGKVEHVLALTKILLSPDRAARLRAAEILGDYQNKEALADLRRAHEIELDSGVRAALYRAIQTTLMGY